MAKDLKKAMANSYIQNSKNLKEMYYDKMLIAQKEVDDLKKQIANGDTSEETQQNLIVAENELERVTIAYYESE